MVLIKNKESNIRKTFIWGGKSQLRILLPYLESINRFPDYVFDPYLKNLEFEIKGTHFSKEEQISQYASECDSFVVAIGGNHGKKRHQISKFLKNKFKLKPLLMMHHNSYICETSKYGDGLMMMPGSIVNSYSSIGDQCIINTNASIDHESILGNGVHIMGSAVITGRVTIGDFVTVGSNATILPDLKIGDNSIIGAGAVVTKDVPSCTTVVGIPARKFNKKI